MKSETANLKDAKIEIKFVLSGLWISLMFLYVYADILSLYRPGQIGKMIDGYMGPFKANQLALALAGLLMLVSIAMIALSLLLPAKSNRLVNIVVGIFLTLIGISNLLGEAWFFYVVYGVLEMVITISIVVLSVKWPRSRDA